MLKQDEAQKIAAATNIHRPDWSVAQIMGVLGKDNIRLKRTYRDTAIAAVALACDPATRQPTRLLESGPWWEAAAPAKPTIDYRTITDDDCAICTRPQAEHALPTLRDHEWEPQHARAESALPTPEQKAALEAARIEAEKKRTAKRKEKPKGEPRDPAEVIASHTDERKSA